MFSFRSVTAGYLILTYWQPQAIDKHDDHIKHHSTRGRKMFRPGAGQTFEDYCNLKDSESKDGVDYSVGNIEVLV